mgnify:CR=1 FL=1
MPRFSVMFLYDTEYLEKGKKHYLSGEKKEDYGFVKQRETGKEVLVCDEMGIPFYSLDDMNTISGQKIFLRSGIDQYYLHKKILL